MVPRIPVPNNVTPIVIQIPIERMSFFSWEKVIENCANKKQKKIIIFALLCDLFSIWEIVCAPFFTYLLYCIIFVFSVSSYLSLGSLSSFLLPVTFVAFGRRCILLLFLGFLGNDRRGDFRLDQVGRRCSLSLFSQLLLHEIALPPTLLDIGSEIFSKHKFTQYRSRVFLRFLSNLGV